MPIRKNTAFTLIEMLVVIAIILVIAGIILSVMWNARDKTHEAVCINNFRQLSSGLRMYMADWDSGFPRDIRDFNKPYINNTKVYYCPNDIRGQPKVLPTPELVAKGFGPELNSPSYIYHSPPLIGDEFTKRYEKIGDSFPILFDDWHNSVGDRKEEKDKKYIILRLNGSVQAKREKVEFSFDL